MDGKNPPEGETLGEEPVQIEPGDLDEMLAQDERDQAESGEFRPHLVHSEWKGPRLPRNRAILTELRHFNLVEHVERIREEIETSGQIPINQSMEAAFQVETPAGYEMILEVSVRVASREKY